MTFDLSFPTQTGEESQLELESGEVLFVLGANGTGKSSLMLRFTHMNANVARKISAHRQTWMNTDALDMTPAAKVQTEKHIQNEDRQHQSRYRDSYAAQRASMTIYELVEAENVRARRIAAFVDADKIDDARHASEDEAPITVINELLRLSNIPITISIQNDGRVMASKEGGPEYSAAELSDGERNALLIAGNILTVPPDTLLVIDEPERHLHRSIIGPLLTRLFERRSNCGFVVSTHDHGLPMEIPDAKTLLLRSCSFNGHQVQGWEADVFSADSPIDEAIKRDLLGARRKILFVEGTESSLDKSLYSLIFPMVSVIPKGSCHDVERAVAGGRAVESFHWLRAFGIVDGDGYASDEIDRKRERGIYAVPFYSVEAIYFHPKVIEWIAARQAKVSGEDASVSIARALEEGVAAIGDQTERLSQKMIKKLVRKQIIEQIPNDDELLSDPSRKTIKIKNEAQEILAEKKCELDKAVGNGDWEAILTKCPIRESAARNSISKNLGFPGIGAYESAVRHLLQGNNEAITFVRSLFDDLFDKLQD